MLHNLMENYIYNIFTYIYLHQKILKNNGKRNKKSHPKWHDLSCAEAHKKVVLTGKLLKSNPNNPYLRGKLQTETKQYKRLAKSKQKEFVDKLFSQLEDMEASNPRGYMELIRSMRTGNFDKDMPDDTSHIDPSIWHQHFNNTGARQGGHR